MANGVQQTWRHRRELLEQLLKVTEAKDDAVDALAIAIERAMLHNPVNSGEANMCITIPPFLIPSVEKI